MRTRTRMRMRPTATLPATGIDVLLVGDAEHCRPIAESLLRSRPDRGDDTVRSGSGAGAGDYRRALCDISLARASSYSGEATARDGRTGRRGGDDAGTSARKRRRSDGIRGGEGGGSASAVGMSSSDATATTTGAIGRTKTTTTVPTANSAAATARLLSIASGGASVGGGGHHLSAALRARHVRIAPSLPLPTDDSDGASSSSSSSSPPRRTGTDFNIRVDYVAFVVSTRDPSALSQLRDNARRLHPDYAHLGRVAVIVVLDHSSHRGGSRSGCLPEMAATPALLDAACRGAVLQTGGGGGGGAAPRTVHVPVLRCDEGDGGSVDTVSRMLLRAAAIGCRGVMATTAGGGGVADADSGGAAAGDDDGGSIVGGGGGISPLFFSSMF